MPEIFDNINQHLITALKSTIEVSHRGDFCVGYFNLRGWKQIANSVDQWSGGKDQCCRLLIGMQRMPQEELRQIQSISNGNPGIDNQTALRLKKRLAEEFRDQLTIGVPTQEDEKGLRKLAAQIRDKKVVVKLFLKHPLHAKLYLMFREDPVSPIVGYLGSSNLTLSGLSYQGELNVDVLDQDACRKLSKWFDERWEDRWCIDISDELEQIIQESWAGEQTLSPYEIYLKMAYHLSKEAREGLTEFRIPRDFGNKLFDFQVAAVKIAAHHLNKRGGVLIGDVVGLGKTLMATALARIFQDDHYLSTLILCPKNLVGMWESYTREYGLHAMIVPFSQVIQLLPDVPARFRLVLIDESHNLRNRDGKRYRAIQEYIRQSESKVIMLSATPYNKTYLDLANQLRLFIPEEKDIGIRPERLMRDMGETQFMRRYQSPPRSLAAFEKSEYADDWRELMRLYLVRRTRSFIKGNYAKLDDEGREYLKLEDGTQSYFPIRLPKTVQFTIEDSNGEDQYARLYSEPVVRSINSLLLPRYGLGNYTISKPDQSPNGAEKTILQDLSRAGKGLMGFCRTNLFKRLESSGHAFTLSVERHILRNFIYLHAIESKAPIPIGTQDPGILDARLTDVDVDDVNAPGDLFEDDVTEVVEVQGTTLRKESDFLKRAEDVYAQYATKFRRRFRWIRSDLFNENLRKHLLKDARKLIQMLKTCGDWLPEKDVKLNLLEDLLIKQHPDEKVIVFTQFADTVSYLEQQLKKRGADQLSGVTGGSSDPTHLAHRFSPVSNDKQDQIAPEQTLRVLIATDVLSEGQNLQDAAIIVNFDLPWAIIRLIQRAGRVDRIGQLSERILCYSFLPAEGVERIINLRARVRQRLHENAEVVGTDESFFEDDDDEDIMRDLFTEKAGVLDGDDDTEIDLASYAYQIWKNATDRDPSLAKRVPELPSVVYATKPHNPNTAYPEGALVYVRTAEGNDALAWVDKGGNSITESQFSILRAAECGPETLPQLHHDNHHQMVLAGLKHIASESKSVGGTLGRPSGARFRVYERLKSYADRIKNTLFDTALLHRTIEEMYRYPMTNVATDTLNRQLRSGISDDNLAQLVIALREDNRLCVIHDDVQRQESRIICSMGLKQEV
ncbi:MAG: superfamily II DNA or RNA helicase [Candidatus Latescibacterota bacterium]|jgi:superfamily II DNA or RNA helicase